MKKHVLKQCKESADLISKMADVLLEPIINVAEAISQSLQRGNKILLFGNGGSAADSQHIAAEFVNRFMIERPPLPAIALTTDSSVITSIGNDYGFSEIFVKQIKSLGNRGDVAIAISTSGTSQNILKGVRAAKKMDIITVGLTSLKGQKLIDLVDLPLAIPSDYTPRIQEAHIVVGHILCDLTDMMLFKNFKR
jgi:D-sedoheptulose 7-phosphate isomerase